MYIQDKERRETHYEYDFNHNMILAKDNNGDIKRNYYDCHNRLINMIL